MKDGLVLLDKPYTITSTQASSAVKRLLSVKKAGHVGTLDPLATGLLPICLGEATKFIAALLQNADKCYCTEMILGKRTLTGDAEGEVIAESSKYISSLDFHQALPQFRGVINQTPSVYSAIKVNGIPSYEWVRKHGVIPELPSRTVNILMLQVLNYHYPHCTMRVLCSKGTYIRSLVEDIGEFLGCHAYVNQLRRESIDQYSVHEAISLDVYRQLDLSQRMTYIIPLERLLPYPILPIKQVSTLFNGQVVMHDDDLIDRYQAVCQKTGCFLGVLKKASQYCYHVERLVSPKYYEAYISR